ncbi:hypothetical protein SORBI_3005G080075 [Sorghum bicolor]|uniref:Uncharacterized protein n=1 Tax=Sorghum bicolor TaxID=4558 RepID=A0A1Z5RHI4_SORBI|nr:hypothetical protein SORBI_3005G080075 [Sorghum bicolor]
MEPAPSLEAPSSPRGAPLSATPAFASPPPSALCLRQETPPGPGIVGRFINIAPILLGGVSTSVLPEMAHDDWFARSVEAEFTCWQATSGPVDQGSSPVHSDVASPPPPSCRALTWRLSTIGWRGALLSVCRRPSHPLTVIRPGHRQRQRVTLGAALAMRSCMLPIVWTLRYRRRG